jgi:hypothetical protein
MANTYLDTGTEKLFTVGTSAGELAYAAGCGLTKEAVELLVKRNEDERSEALGSAALTSGER